MERSSQTDDESLRDYNLVVEGEFNQLQIQSLGARTAELRGKAPEAGYFDVIAVGGVSNVDVATVAKLATRALVVLYDNDQSGAGFELVQRIRERTPVDAITTPEVGTDVDDFIRMFGADYEARWPN